MRRVRISAFNAAFLLSVFMIIATHISYPRYNKSSVHSTLSWDAAGYYWYLPSIFIYKDLKYQRWANAKLQALNIGVNNIDEMSIKAPNGAFVMKYSCGMALLETPGFLTAHLIAKKLGYRPDGFSLPYQAAVQWVGILVSILGIYLCGKFLLRFFSNKLTAILLLLLVIGTNYLNYSAIDTSLTHTWLFTFYAALLLITEKFYRHPNNRDAILIGLLCGFMILIRPTEVISISIPLFWGLKSIKPNDIKNHMLFLFNKFRCLISAAVCAAAIVSIQLFYWKWASGSWLVYSYGEQGFSWLHPHLYSYLLSARSGWLSYTPVMMFSIMGIVFGLSPHWKWPVIPAFALLAIYVVSAWDI